MSWPVHTFDKNTDLRFVANQMIAEKISAFLITDDKKIVGIVTSDDMLKALIELLEDKQVPATISLESVFTDPWDYDWSTASKGVV